MLKYIKSCLSHSFALNSEIRSGNIFPIVPATMPSSTNDVKYNASVPLCDILARKPTKRKIYQKKESIESSCSDEEEEVPRVVKKKIVKVISDAKDVHKKNSDEKENDDSDYELKKVNPNKMFPNHEKKKLKKNTEEVLSTSKPKGLSYEKMIEEKRAERIALLKSMEIDQIKSDIFEAVNGIKEMKKNTISRSYKKVHSPPSVEPIRRSRRLANMEIDFSEKALEEMAEKKSFQISEIDNLDSIPSEYNFKDALKSASSYEEFSSDLSIQDSKSDRKFISYDKAVLKNMTLNEFNVCKVVPARITSAAWCPSKEDLLVGAGDKFGNLGLWKIKDSESTPHLFKVHKSNIPNMQFCTFNPTQLITASYEGIIRCGDLVEQTFNEIYDVSDEARCTWFDFLSPSTFLVSQSNGQVALVDKKTEGKTSEKRHACHDFTIKTICVHPINKNAFVTADNKSIIRLWDLRKLQKRPVVEIRHHERTVNSAYFSPVTGNSLLTTSLDDSICIFDCTNLTEGDIKLKTKIKHNNFTGRWLTIFRATWLPNSDDIFAVGCMEQPRRVQIFDKDLNLYQNMVSDNLTTFTSVHRFHPYQSALAAGNSSGKLFVFT